jgi:hypothetical protein
MFSITPNFDPQKKRSTKNIHTIRDLFKVKCFARNFVPAHHGGRFV